MGSTCPVIVLPVLPLCRAVSSDATSGARLRRDRRPRHSAMPLKSFSRSIFNLRIARVEAPRSATDFLFTDVSGEMFDHASDSTSDCRQLLFLRRATDFLLLIDGEKCVVRDDERYLAGSEVENTPAILSSIVRCSRHTAWSMSCGQNTTTSRLRRIRRSINDSVKMSKRDFVRTFGQRVSRLVFTQVAARPIRDWSLGFGHGIPGLLDSWMIDHPLLRPMELLPKTPSPMPATARESEQFAMCAILRVGVNNECYFPPRSPANRTPRFREDQLSGGALVHGLSILTFPAGCR